MNKYTILKSRDLYIIYEDDKAIFYFYTLIKAQIKIMNLIYNYHNK